MMFAARCPTRPSHWTRRRNAMNAMQPRHSKEEFARRGNAIYERDLKARLEPEFNGQFVVIDIESGHYEVDAGEFAASDHLLARCPSAQIWMRLVGSPHARRFGGRPLGRPSEVFH